MADSAERLGVQSSTCEKYKRRHPDVWVEGYLAGLEEFEEVASVHALHRQAALIDNDDPQVALRACADVRTEYGRGLDRALKRDELLARLVRDSIGRRVQLVIDTMMRHVPEAARADCERDLRAVVATEGSMAP